MIQIVRHNTIRHVMLLLLIPVSVKKHSSGEEDVMSAVMEMKYNII